STAFMEIAQERVSSQYCKGFIEFLRERGINGVVYIPYGRSFLALQKFTIQEILSYFKSPLLELDLKFLITRPNYLMEYYMGLSTYDEKIFNLIKPLLRGQVKDLGNKLVYVEEDKIIPWEYVSASVLEIVSFLLSVKEGSLVLFEEPETQLHEELQLLMSVVLYALSSFNRIVISTHSQTILYNIAHLSMLRPTKEELKDLFEDLKVRDYEALAEAVEKANQKEVKVKIYHFTEGEVKEVSVDEAVKGMPGTIDVLEKEFKWFSSLHSKRLFGEG
ncbi:MAG: AAA family ATPase, partial [Sulfolobales archaeon]|nr:AAA family ATPase [Sulfolobales archaeon]